MEKAEFPLTHKNRNICETPAEVCHKSRGGRRIDLAQKQSEVESIGRQQSLRLRDAVVLSCLLALLHDCCHM